MSYFRLLINGFRHYFPAHLAVASGIAVSTAIIIGGLIVGDSITHSLMETARYRTGHISHLVRGGDRIFTQESARVLSDVQGLNAAPAMRVEGIALAGDGQMRLNRIQVWGLTKEFNEVAGFLPGLDSLEREECIISENLSSRLGLKAGDRFLLRIRKSGPMPANAPFVSEEVQVVPVWIRVKEIAGRDELGRLNLQVSQTAPYNVFISLQWMNRLLDLDKHCNLVLISGQRANRREIEKRFSENWTAEDAGLELEYLEETAEWNVTSSRVFIDHATALHVRSHFPDANPVLTYFANSIRSGEIATPYSFVSSLAEGVSGEDRILVNEWLAADLQIVAGDTVWLDYFEIGPLRKLTEKSKSFVVQEIVPMEGRFADPELMPFIPGLSDAGSCSEWEAGVPVDLGRIRRKDEDYWSRYRGTPKAFISLPTAEKLWQNRFGDLTSFRIKENHFKIPGGILQNSREIPESRNNGVEKAVQKAYLEKELVRGLDPADLGFRTTALHEEATYAAVNGVDFSQLFLGLSFFILVSGIILTVLLLNYNLVKRSAQIATLSALGFPDRSIRFLMIAENILTALTGGILGAVLAIVYTRLVFEGLNRVWFEIVRTRVLEVDINAGTVVGGLLVSLLLSLITIILSSRRTLKRKTAEVQRGLQFSLSRSMRNLTGILALALILAGSSLVLTQFFQHGVLSSGIFFLAGGFLLLSLWLLSLVVLLKENEKYGPGFDLSRLRNRNLSYNSGRSMTIIILLALGTFLVISTGANRRGVFSDSNDRSSGTGGFLFFAESTIPLLSDLNDPAVRRTMGLTGDFSVVQFRLSEGDDASCLNLNRISNPRIMATHPEELEGRFTFATRSEHLDGDNPWASLEKQMDGVVPGIADQTVIQWGLGKKVGDTLEYASETGESLKILLIGGLAPSIFQGHVIISESQFLRYFPSSSGSNILLIDRAGDTDGNTGMVEETPNTSGLEEDLNVTFRDYGWEMTPAATRLAEFNSVSNTYLSIFMIMGTFGLVLGTIGLAIVLVRNIREQRYEIAYLKAAGFTHRMINRMVTGEYTRLLLTGVLGGLIAAVIATLPVFLSPESEVSPAYVAGLTAIILANGMVWIWLLSTWHGRRQKIVEDLRNE